MVRLCSFSYTTYSRAYKCVSKLKRVKPFKTEIQIKRI